MCRLPPRSTRTDTRLPYKTLFRSDAGSCSSRIVFDADAHTMGLEFELSASPFTGLDLGLSGSYVEAEFDSTLTRPDGTVIEGIRDGKIGSASGRERVCQYV